MKLFFFIICITFLTLISGKKIESQDIPQRNTIFISVNGLVCDFCARSIEKLFGKKKSVKSIDVNLEKMLITVNMKQGQNLTDETINQLIGDSGYDVKEIRR